MVFDKLTHVLAERLKTYENWQDYSEVWDLIDFYREQRLPRESALILNLAWASLKPQTSPPRKEREADVYLAFALRFQEQGDKNYQAVAASINPKNFFKFGDTKKTVQNLLKLNLPEKALEFLTYSEEKTAEYLIVVNYCLEKKHPLLIRALESAEASAKGSQFVFTRSSGFSALAQVYSKLGHKEKARLLLDSAAKENGPLKVPSFFKGLFSSNQTANQNINQLEATLDRANALSASGFISEGEVLFKEAVAFGLALYRQEATEAIIEKALIGKREELAIDLAIEREVPSEKVLEMLLNKDNFESAKLVSSKDSKLMARTAHWAIERRDLATAKQYIMEIKPNGARFVLIAELIHQLLKKQKHDEARAILLEAEAEYKSLEKKTGSIKRAPIDFNFEHVFKTLSGMASAWAELNEAVKSDALWKDYLAWLAYLEQDRILIYDTLLAWEPILKFFQNKKNLKEIERGFSTFLATIKRGNISVGHTLNQKVVNYTTAQGLARVDALLRQYNWMLTRDQEKVLYEI